MRRKKQAHARRPKRPPARSTAVDTLDTQGASLLRADPRSLRALAAALDCSPQAVANWRSGLKVPNEAARQRIEAELRIPAAAWDMAPGTSTSNPAPGPPPLYRVDALQRCEELLASLRAQRLQPGLSPATLARISDVEGRQLQLLQRLQEANDKFETRVLLEHPLWRQLRARILHALQPYPAAARAVLDALKPEDTSPTSS